MHLFISVHDVVHKWLTYKSELTFNRIYRQKMGKQIIYVHVY